MASSSGSVIRRAGLVLILAGVVVLGWTSVRLWLAWNDVARVEFQTAAAREALAAADNPYRGTDTTLVYVEEDIDPFELSTPVVGGEIAQSADEFARAVASSRDEALDVFLIIGSDQRAEIGSSRRADVILVFIRPTDGTPPSLASIPRDLYLPNPCTGGMSRVNANLNGCGSYATGPEQVAIAVEDYTGVNIDHFVVFDFQGFVSIVNRVGGVDVCVTNAVRDNRVKPVNLNLPAGCSKIGGDQALAWVRSRKTESLIGGVWRPIGATDLTRNRRQQDLVIQAMGRLAGFTNISELTALAEDLASAFTIDSGISLRDAVSTAWKLRSVDPASITRVNIPVADYVDPHGAWVLVPRDTFQNLLVAANPELAQYFVAAG